ncbi:MAG: replicative DNA helicase [Candidatus Edwardsbacteria bacterium]
MPEVITTSRRTNGGSATIERVLPQSVEAERAVLGAMLLEKEAIGKAVEVLGEEDVFHLRQHSKIYKVILSLYERDEAVDLVTTTEELRRRKEIEEIGGPVYLTTLLESVATAANVEYYAKIVLEKAILRRLIQVATQIVSLGYNGSQNAEELLDQAEQMIFDIGERRLRQGLISIKTLLHHTFEIITELYEHKRKITGVESGFIDLDKMTAGFQKGDLIVIAGRPSMGKTSLALNMVDFIATEKGISTAIFSLEMSKEQLVQRLLCSKAKVSSYALRTGFLQETQWGHLTAVAGVLAENPIYIDDSSTLSALEIRAKARRLKTETDLGLVIVDYLQLMRGPEKAENRQQEIAEIARGLKGLAKELNVPVIAVSQLSRGPERREDRRPVLADLRESGAIEQDADMVIFIYRDEQYHPETSDQKGIAEINVAKQRSGPTGVIKLAFIKEYMRFENLIEM